MRTRHCPHCDTDAMFGRATITLGIGPHSSFSTVLYGTDVSTCGRMCCAGHEHPYSIQLHYHRRDGGGRSKSLSPMRFGSDSDMRHLMTLDANCNEDTCRFVLRHRHSVQRMSFGLSHATLTCRPIL